MARARNYKTKVEGADELVKMFGLMQDEAEAILEEASEEGAKIVLNEAKSNVKFVSGKLRDSLDIKPEKSKKPTKKAHRVYSKGVRQGGVRYGVFVETGTSKMEAQPFLRPALDKNKGRIIRKVKETIVKGIDKAVR